MPRSGSELSVSALCNHNHTKVATYRTSGVSLCALSHSFALCAAAGMLWTPMHDPGTQMQNLKALADQIKAAVPATAIAAAQNRPRVAPGQVASSGDSTELQSLRDQLDTLRQDLAQAVSQQVAAAADDSNAAPGVVLAPIPGEVPPLSRHLRPTSDMLKLKSLLLAGTSGSSTTAVTSEQSKIGALGMGGIGKTVTASWIARDDDVRRHFDLIVWYVHSFSVALSYCVLCLVS